MVGNSNQSDPGMAIDITGLLYDIVLASTFGVVSSSAFRRVIKMRLHVVPSRQLREKSDTCGQATRKSLNTWNVIKYNSR